MSCAPIVARNAFIRKRFTNVLKTATSNLRPTAAIVSKTDSTAAGWPIHSRVD
jgi:hypothetical protein